MTYLGCILACVLAHGPVSFNSNGAPAATEPTPATVAVLRPLEVRVRKMFMVRPDLLHYPIPYDVIC